MHPAPLQGANRNDRGVRGGVRAPWGVRGARHLQHHQQCPQIHLNRPLGPLLLVAAVDNIRFPLDYFP